MKCLSLIHKDHSRLFTKASISVFLIYKGFSSIKKKCSPALVYTDLYLQICISHDRLWKGYHESRRFSRDTYPESYVTTKTSIRRLTTVSRFRYAISTAEEGTQSLPTPKVNFYLTQCIINWFWQVHSPTKLLTYHFDWSK